MLFLNILLTDQFLIISISLLTDSIALSCIHLIIQILAIHIRFHFLIYFLSNFLLWLPILNIVSIRAIVLNLTIFLITISTSTKISFSVSILTPRHRSFQNLFILHRLLKIGLLIIYTIGLIFLNYITIIIYISFLFLLWLFI